MNILRTIIERKKKEVKELPFLQDLDKSNRSLVDALSATPLPIIGEIKPKSPSSGPLIRRTDVPKFVELFSKHVQAISVLCDSVDFGGGYDLLQEVRPKTELPILAKEFIIDPVQIHLARAAGADAVLLIAAVLQKQSLRILSNEAGRLGMDVLIEVHDEKEIEHIPDISNERMIIGINNRDLRTLEVDTDATKKLSPLLRKKFPKHTLLSLSGLNAKADIKNLSNFVDGFLIGTSILHSENPEEFLLSLKS